MSYEVGDGIVLTFDVYNDAGVLTNATTAALTITLPDNTTTTPAVANPPAVTGRYTASYTTVQEGRHLVRWVTTVPNRAHLDTFDVRETATPAIVSLADTKRHLNIPAANTTDDEELRDFIESATSVVEYYVGPVVRRTKTARLTGGQHVLVLPFHPVQSLTSVKYISDNTDAEAVADLDLNPAGVVRRKDGGRIVSGALLVTYVVGSGTVKPNMIAAGKIIIQHLWETQRGGAGAGLPRQGGSETAVPGFGFAIPNRAVELLRADQRRAMSA